MFLYGNFLEPETMDNERIEQLKINPATLRVYASRLKLGRKGRIYETNCPFHDDTNPSFQIFKNAEDCWMWKCQSNDDCGSGNVAQFVQKFDKVSFPEALNRIEKEVANEWDEGKDRVDKVFQPIGQESKKSVRYPLDKYQKLETALLKSPLAREWLLKERGISFSTAQKFHLGFRQDLGKIAGDCEVADKGWIAIPTIRENEVVSIKYRSIVAKEFRRQPGMETELFNIETIDMLDTLYITEGEFDAIVLEQAGFKAVSIPNATTNLTSAMRDALMSAETRILAGDSDDAGQKAMTKLWNEFQFNTFRLQWPEGCKDANDTLMKAAGGNLDIYPDIVSGLTQDAFGRPMEHFSTIQKALLSANQTNLADHPDRLRAPWPIVDRMAILLPGSIMAFSATNSKMGKELDVKTKVMTPSGATPIGSLQTGDLVIGRNGKPTNVLNVFPQGVKDAWQITFSDNTTVVCGADHQWAVRSYWDSFKDNPYRVLSLKDLLESDLKKRRWRIPLPEPVEFCKNTLSLDPYFLGALLGDGGFSGSSVTFTNTDRDLIENVRRSAPPGVVLKRRLNPDIQYTFSAKHAHPNPLNEALRQLGLFGKRSGDKFIPETYKFSSVADRIALLQGLLDTDGCATKTNSVHFCSTSKQLCEDVIWITRSLGGAATLLIQNRGERSTLYYTYVRLPEQFTPFRLRRKFANMRPPRGRRNRFIESIDPVTPRDMCCIEVEADDGLYVVDDFIVTHNTIFQTNLTLYAARYHKEVVLQYQCELSDNEYANIVAAHVLKRDRNHLTAADYAEASSYLEGIKFYIGHNTLLTKVDEVLDLIEAGIRRLGATVVVLDHIHFICRNERNEAQAQANAMQRIKLMADRYGVKFIVVGQPRKAEQTKRGKRIHMNDMKGSESLVSDASAIFIIHRDEIKVKDPDNPPTDDYQTKTEVHMLGARSKGDGPTYGELVFLGNIATFGSLAKDIPPEPNLIDLK